MGHPRLGARNADMFNMKRAGYGKTHAAGRRWRGPLGVRPWGPENHEKGEQTKVCELYTKTSVMMSEHSVAPGT